jgi:SAM-dependent methyltransferase
MRILDIGSGDFPLHLNGHEIIHSDIDKKFEVQIRCDIHHLPFVNHCFELVYASHILEHLDHPTKAVAEIARVSDSAVIKIPNAGFYKWGGIESFEHFYSWNAYTIINMVGRCFRKVRLTKTFGWERDSGLIKRQLKFIKIVFFAFLTREKSELTVIASEPDFSYSEKKCGKKK